jgi:N-acetylmuramoyl-L-alanine amidase
MRRSAVGLLVGACLLAVPATADADFPHVVTRGETLASVAATDGLSVAELAAANGISTEARLTTGMVLQIPPKGEETASALSTSSSQPIDSGAGEPEGGSYVVRRGDTLAAIAARAGTTVDELASLNGIAHRNLVVVGTTLTLPEGAATTSTEPTASSRQSTGEASSGGSYVVEPGDTLGKIAARVGTTTSELAEINGIRHVNLIVAGTTLSLPGESGGSGAGTPELVSDATSGPSAANGSTYTIRPGDTLASIAAREGTTVDELASLNGISHPNLVIAGTTLTLPGESGVTDTAGGTASSSAGEVPTTVGSGGPPFPTDQRVSASDIASTADAEGVPPSLAEAIGWQESGFNNAAVSSVGAVGVMQIVPDTWQWIDEHLATIPLQAASASDNVRAGVLLLHALLAQTGSDSGAAAGYYQGLASIRRNGEFPSTRRYVASVMALVSRFGG